jgi:hypothetical protein
VRAVSPNAQRIAGVVGIVFVVLIVIPFVVVPPPPLPTASRAVVVAYFHDHRAALLPAGWLGILSFPAAMVLVGALTSRMRQAEGERGWLHLVFLGGNLLSIGLAVVLGALSQLLAMDAGGPSFDPGLAKALSDLADLGFAVFFAPTIAAWAAAAILISGTGALPRWLGWWAGLLVVTSLVGSTGAFVESGPLVAAGTVTLVGLSAQFGWWLAASLVLVLRPTAR